MLAKPLEDLRLSDLQALVENRISESRRLEFKRDHYGRREEDRREFAADISAMANAEGGDLVVGVSEENGIASELTGLTAEDPDALVRAIGEALRSSFEPPIPEIRTIWIEIPGGRGVGGHQSAP